MRHLLYASLAAVGAACAGTTQTPSGEAAGPAPSAQTRPVTYGPGTMRFRAVSHAHQEQQIESNTQRLDFLLEYFGTASLTAGSGGAHDLVFVIDSIQAQGGLLNPAELSRARGTRLSGVMRPDGQVTELAGDSLLTGQLQTITTGLRQFFPRIPPGGAEAGRTWSDTTEVNVAGSPHLSLRFVNDRRATEWTEYAGRRALRLDVSSRYSVSGKGQQMGQEFTLSGTGVRQASQYLSPQGHYVASVARDSSLVTISLPAVGMSFPSTQIRSDTVSVIP